MEFNAISSVCQRQGSQRKASARPFAQNLQRRARPGAQMPLQINVYSFYYFGEPKKVIYTVEIINYFA
jgi:hypothetical protein